MLSVLSNEFSTNYFALQVIHEISTKSGTRVSENAENASTTGLLSLVNVRERWWRHDPHDLHGT